MGKIFSSALLVVFIFSIFLISSGQVIAACSSRGGGCDDFIGQSCCLGLSCQTLSLKCCDPALSEGTGVACYCGEECASGICNGITATNPQGVCAVGQPQPPQLSAGELQSPINATSFEAIVGTVTNFIVWAAIIIAPLLILIGAIFILISAGDTTKLATGRRIILYAVIGLAIVLFSKGLVALLQNVLGVK